MYKQVLIYCYYDKNGIIQNDIVNLLSEFRKLVDYIVIVVNGNIECEDILMQYCDELIIRPNTCFDIGAYKHALDMPEIRKIATHCDELILCNNSFWGPFVPLKIIFETMKQRKCDFWGITRSEIGIMIHIQSYFIVYKNTVLRDNRFWVYLDKYITGDMSFVEVLATFENDLTHYLIELGYSFDTYISYSNIDLYKHPSNCLSEYNVPILKKKTLFDEYYNTEQFINSLLYINQHFNYDINNILKTLPNRVVTEYQNAVSKLVPYSKYSLITDFINHNDSIFIYGIGKQEQMLFVGILFPRKINKIAGYIVSDNQDDIPEQHRGLPVLHISEIKDNNTPIIIALNPSNAREISDSIKQFTNLIFIN